MPSPMSKVARLQWVQSFEILGKWSEIFGKSPKTSLCIMIILSDKKITWSLRDTKNFPSHVKNNILSSLLSQKFQRRCCFQNGMLWRNVLECDMLLRGLPSFGQTCSITIPMAINPQWKIALEAIPCLECSRERTFIAMTLRRKTVVAVIDSKPEQTFFNSLLNRWCWGNISFNQQ